MNSLFIIDNHIDNGDKKNINKVNEDIKYLINTETKLKLLDYNFIDIKQLNENDNIILLKKTTLKIHKNAKFSHCDNKKIYFKGKGPSKHPEIHNNFYIFYKHIHTKQNMMKYLLNALEYDLLDIK
tara:strand:+ start:458 stop:835 length:378 start_codon:yes stop_codon:yes gene_type:complete